MFIDVLSPALKLNACDFHLGGLPAVYQHSVFPPIKTGKNYQVLSPSSVSVSVFTLPFCFSKQDLLTHQRLLCNINSLQMEGLSTDCSKVKTMRKKKSRGLTSARFMTSWLVCININGQKSLLDLGKVSSL